MAKSIKSDQKNVHNNVKVLVKYGLVETLKKIQSVQGGTYSAYRLTSKGAAYVYTQGNEKAVFKTLDNYKTGRDTVLTRVFIELIHMLSRSTAVKLMRGIGRANLEYGDKIWQEENFTHAIMLCRTNFSNSEMRELKRAVINIQEFQEMVVNTFEAAKDEFLSSDLSETNS